MFRRELSIKSLFDPKDVLTRFSVVEFKSVSALKAYEKAGLFTGTNENFIIPITCRDDLIETIKIWKRMAPTVFTLHYEENMIDDMLQVPCLERIELSASPEVVKKLSNKQSEALDSILHWTEYYIDADNYDTQIEGLLKLCLVDPRFCWIDIQFDYESFESKPISELHKLYFYINQLRVWTFEYLVPDKYRIIYKGKKNPLRCWVDENLNIGLHGGEEYFKLGDHLQDNGETLEFHELNRIRKILDIQFPDSLITNMYLVDLEQNNRITGDYYRIPFTTTLISQWFEDKE